jgi:hypothetical protein
MKACGPVRGPSKMKFGTPGTKAYQGGNIVSRENCVTVVTVERRPSACDGGNDCAQRRNEGNGNGLTQQYMSQDPKGLRGA